MTNQNPYLENVRDLEGHPGEMRERKIKFSVPETFGEALATVPAGTEMDLDLRFESVHEGILVSAEARTTLHAECGRCLREFEQPFEVDFQELFTYTPTEDDEYGVHDNHVDLEPPLRDAVVLALPFQPVCSPDCPGLDPESGLLRESTSTPQTQEEAADDSVAIDPRWAKLAEFQAENEA